MRKAELDIKRRIPIEADRPDIRQPNKTLTEGKKSGGEGNNTQVEERRINVNNKYDDTCAWAPNKVFIQFLLVSVETARVLLQSLWARLSTGASREAPVDNECLGKSRQVGGSGESWNMSYWQLGEVPRLRYPGLGTLTTSNPGI